MSVSLKHAISPRAIAIAIGAACLVYAFMVVMSVLSGTEMLESIEAKMASQTVASSLKVYNRLFEEADPKPLICEN